MKCRICEKKIKDIFCDLGRSPLANSFISNKQYFKKEKFYPLKVFFCKKCKLPQLPEHVKAKSIFKRYDYFSSFSKSWLMHSENYANEMIKSLKLDENSKVCELASNDGYLLQFFKKKNINVLGVEPAKNVAIHAKRSGIKTITDFFSEKLSQKIKKKYKTQDLIICNNVLAHVPQIKDFLLGIKNLLSENGVATFEFPHFLNLIKYNQFDTIYHEHFSYLSVSCLEKIFKKLKLRIFNVKKVKTHGGSLRLYVNHSDNYRIKISNNVNKIIMEEIRNNLFSIKTFNKFNKKLLKIKNDFINLIISLKKAKKKVAAYGAAAKGNTFLNYCKINSSMLDFIIDKNPYKNNKFLPGSHIKIHDSKYLIKMKPDYLIILPWNIKKEVMTEVKSLINCSFVTCIPKVTIH
jgi:2-polyprenyl-3-methyl-5-hydroxy-6-metoxy-1,4-benzoquinol methylase